MLLQCGIFLRQGGIEQKIRRLRHDRTGDLEQIRFLLLEPRRAQIASHFEVGPPILRQVVKCNRGVLWGRAPSACTFQESNPQFAKFGNLCAQRLHLPRGLGLLHALVAGTE